MNKPSINNALLVCLLAPGNIEVNPIMTWYKAMIFPLADRELSFGSKSASNIGDLESLWVKNEVSPQELKKSALRDLGNLLL